jgi:hypothetical protein
MGYDADVVGAEPARTTTAHHLAPQDMSVAQRVGVRSPQHQAPPKASGGMSASLGRACGAAPRIEPIGRSR